LQHASFSHSNLRSAQLVGAHLEACLFSCVNAEETYFTSSTLHFCDFINCYLGATRFVNSMLHDSSFENCELTSATSFGGAEMCGSAFGRIDLTLTRLEQSQIETCLGQTRTKLAKDLLRPKHWLVHPIGWMEYPKEVRIWRYNKENYVPPVGEGD
jgi:uncharacterized protein YjbI with pentapeptide repeats